MFFVLLLILLFNISCSNNNDNISTENKVEIILSDDKENIEVREYSEKDLKSLALDSLKEFLSLPYNEEGVKIAYDKFYSKSYKDRLLKSRNIGNSQEYVSSYPSLDFEFETSIDKVYSITLEGQKVYIDADSSVYDRVNKANSKMRQTFVMLYEDDRWVFDN